jgi:molybdopterin synthase sulfur carrier subunit
VAEVIEQLEQRFPGIKARLCDGEELRSSLAVVIDTEVSRLGLRQPVGADTEVHFVPAVSGG